MQNDQEKLFKQALQLSIVTIIFNVIEGLVSIYFGYQDETLTLFGFGIDSFIEVLSAAGIYVMINRIMSNPNSPRNKFEITSLKITGISFYLLSLGLILSVFMNLYLGNKPKTTLPGVIIAIISIISMIMIIYGKLNVGRKLNSAPIISDANCTKACVYMSIVLLTASLVYELTGLSYIDSIGTIGIIYFSINEGREAFEKSRKISK
jgi:divalent metal cation (Fe/Co/Zn/Cd) transporter